MEVDRVSSQQVSAPSRSERKAEEVKREDTERDRSPPKVEGKGERVDTSA